MKTYIFEGKVTALSSISHNGGELNGNVSMFRREKFFCDGKIVSIPVISGNALRGILRDVGMRHMLTELGYGTKEDGTVQGLDLSSYYFLFSGGSLNKGGGKYDAKYYRKLKKLIPLISLFGGAAGNEILEGKMEIGKLIPLARETKHLLSEEYQPKHDLSVWDYTQYEMYTRRDDAKSDRLLPMLNERLDSELAPAKTTQQMIYQNQTIIAGTEFYWRVVLKDVTHEEYEAFCTALAVFGYNPVLGGKGGTGHGRVRIKFDKTTKIDNNTPIEESAIDLKFGERYKKHLAKNADAIHEMLKDL